MCGIAGQVEFPQADAAKVRAMTAALRHRGPDGQGVWGQGPVALGHTRLSIIDLAGGAQPMRTADGQLAITFNGEIYNYRELRAELRGKYTFETDSDTEVLLHLYREYGLSMFERIRGMFSFALWDDNCQHLVFARDRFGEKPFHYTLQQGVFSFASELGALARGADLGAVDRAALAHYLELLYIPTPATIWDRASKLPPAHFGVFDRSGLRLTRYWSMPEPGSESPGRKDIAQALRDTLRETIDIQLRSDVPVAALLSSGVDSASVVGLMSEARQEPIRTFAVGFGRKDDELPGAREVAKRHETDHRELLVDEDILQQVTDSLAAYSEPFGDSSAVPTFAVFRQVANHVKVVLTGDGGDELFAGYDRYRLVDRFPHFPVPSVVSGCLARGELIWPATSRLRRAANVLGARGTARYRALMEVFAPNLRAALLGTRLPPAPLTPDLESDTDSALYSDLSMYLPDDLLVKVDIAAMHWGLETRCPFLDHRLAEQIIPIPHSAKQDRHEGKLVLKGALADLLPEATRKRKKRGFGSPVHAWLNGPLKSLLHDLVLGPDARVRDLLDRQVLTEVVRNGLQPNGNPHQVWALLALELWARQDRASLGAAASRPSDASRALTDPALSAS